MKDCENNNQGSTISNGAVSQQLRSSVLEVVEVSKIIGV